MKFRLKELRSTNELTQEEMAERFGISVSLYNGLENGKRRMNADYIEGSAAIFGILPSELIIDDPIALPVSGRVGAGARVPLFDASPDGGLFQVAEPPQLRRLARLHPLGAVEVEGDSMAPLYQPGDVLFFSRVAHDGILDEDVGRICIVEDAAGDAWVKQVTLGTQPGLYHLLSQNPQAANRHDQKIKWAARVLLAIPAEMVERI